MFYGYVPDGAYIFSMLDRILFVERTHAQTALAV